MKREFLWPALSGLAGVALALLLSLVLLREPEISAFSPNAQLKRSADFYFDIATGDVRGYSGINKFGQNGDVDSAAAEDIWDGGGDWNEPSTSQVYTFTSTSVNDTAAGTGARTMEIFGLDSAGALQNETMSLAGTGVITANDLYQMIHRMIIRTAGSGGGNAGVITANANTDGTVTAQINAGNNQTLMAVFKVPAAGEGCMVSFYASMYETNLNGTADISIYTKPPGEVWQIKHKIGLTASAGSYQHFYKLPNCFEPLTIIRMNADTSANNTVISAGFGIILHPG